MKIIFLFAFVLLGAAVGTQAKSWKIGPSSVVGMNFASINDAMNSSSVNVGDTLFLDQYYNDNTEQTVTKRVVIIGTGYDTDLSDEKVVARLTKALTFKADKAEVKSVRIEGNINFYATDCIVERCYVTGLIKHQSTNAGMNHIYSCYISGGRIEGYSGSNPSMIDIQNCVIINNDYSVNNISCLTSSIINNNVIYKDGRYRENTYCLASISNSQITNNMVYGNNNGDIREIASGVATSGSGNSIEHNVFSRTGSLGYYPQNMFQTSWSSFFVCTGSYSDYYRLATESGDNPCLTYATDGGEVGCHGGLFGCPSGGRPQYIPYFSKVVVGSRTEDGKLPVSVTVKIQDK